MQFGIFTGFEKGVGLEVSRWSIRNNVDDTDEGSCCLLVQSVTKGVVTCIVLQSPFSSHLHLHIQKCTTTFLWSFAVQCPESGHTSLRYSVYTVTSIKNRHVTGLSQGGLHSK